MKKILGKPVIGYMFERLRLSQRIDKVILATSIQPENDPLAEYIQGLGFDVFRGSEDDVLGRFYLAAQKYGADTVVRLTGDCPLVDPQICDTLIEAFQKNKADYAQTSPRFAEGLDCEVAGFSALEKCFHNAHLKSEREHVTPYIKNHPEQFKIHRLENAVDDSSYRIVVDEPEDFAMLEILFRDFYGPLHPKAGFVQIKAYLDQHQELMAMNAHIIRNEGYLKSVRQDKMVHE